MSTPSSELYTIFCVVLGEDTPFPVEISNKKTAGVLKDMIKQKKEIKDTTADKLTLYHVELADDINLAENAKEKMKESRSPLRATMVLAEIFNGTPKKDTVHILVHHPSLPSAGQKHPRSPSDDIDDLLPRKRYFDSKPGMRPSSRAIPSTFEKQQKNSSTQILCGRPPETHPPIPVALLDPVFGEFLDNVQSYVPEAVDNAFAWKIANAMSNFFGSEALRAQEFREVMSTEYGIELHREYIDRTEYNTDGSAKSNGFFYIISEVKLEVGKGGADPLLQAVSYYLEGVRKHDQCHSLLPCFIVYYYGAAIGFAGIVMTDKVSCQVLTPIIPLNFHPTDDEMLARLARIFGAFKSATNRLKEYYRLGNFDRVQYLFPYPRRYDVLNENGGAAEGTHEFIYTQKCDDKLLFFAVDTETKNPICVKFSRRYSQAAHLHAAKVGLAPRLVGFEKLPGGWFMSIMEDLSLGWEPWKRSTRVSEEQARDFLGKVAKFHSEGFVHGDIRESNLLFRRQDQGDPCGIKLVDFEWSGKHGEVHYPACLTREGRPSSVIDGVPILKEHDDEVVSELLTRLTR